MRHSKKSYSNCAPLRDTEPPYPQSGSCHSKKEDSSAGIARSCTGLDRTALRLGLSAWPSPRSGEKPSRDGRQGFHLHLRRDSPSSTQPRHTPDRHRMLGTAPESLHGVYGNWSSPATLLAAASATLRRASAVP